MDYSDIDTRLTVVLTLKDRVDFTYRWMEYANIIKMPFKIIIADGGKDKEIERLLSSRDSYPNLYYQYVRYPYDETYTDYYAKLASVLKIVNTEYMVFADNDDFYVVNSLRKSVEFLIGHPEYSSCRGEIGGLFQQSKNEFHFGISSRMLNNIDSNTATDRVLQHLGHYNDSHYDVCKTQDRKTAFSAISDLSPSDLFVTEMIDSCLTACFGKIRREKYLYLVRQNNSPESSALAAEKENDTVGRMFVKTWSHDISGFLSFVSEAISKVDCLQDDRLDGTSKMLKKGYRGFLSKAIIENLSEEMHGIPRFLILNSLRVNAIPPGELSGFLYRKFYSKICKVKYKNRALSGFIGKRCWFYHDTLPIANMLNKGKEVAIASRRVD